MFVPILAYHKIQDEFDFSITRITPCEFERQVGFLADCGYASSSISGFVKNKQGWTSRGIVLTFDDAYESVFKHALPVLNKYGFTASIFVITDFVGRWNQWDYSFLKKRSKHCDWDQLKLLAASGWEIGSHTVSHRPLCSLSDAEAWQELRESKEKLEDMLGVPVSAISYPFGRFNKRILDLVKKAGYAAGCTLGYSGAVSEFNDYALPRRGVYLREPLSLFKVKLKNTALAHYDDRKQRLISFCSQGSVLLRYLQSD